MRCDGLSFDNPTLSLALRNPTRQEMNFLDERSLMI